MAEDDRRLVRVGKVMELLDCSDKTAYRLGQRRAIAMFTDPVTGTRRFSLASVLAFMAGNTQPARPQVVGGESTTQATPKRRATRRTASAAAAAPTAAPPWEGFETAPRPRRGGPRQRAARER